VAFGEPHHAALEADQALVDVAELLESRGRGKLDVADVLLASYSHEKGGHMRS
jgi:hypothetical protein